MEGKKPAGGSIVDELFGPKDNHSSNSSAGYFSTVFPPPSAVMDKNASRRPNDGKGQGGSSKGLQYGAKDPRSTPPSTCYASESAESPYFGSSVHYGGRDFYGSSQPKQFSTDTTPKSTTYKNDDDNEAATRGDWWQGSLYY